MLFTSLYGRTYKRSASGCLPVIGIQWLRASICGVIFGSAILGCDARADDYFNPNALELGDINASAANLEKFSRTGGQLPGTYRVDIYLNGRRIDTRDVTFVEDGGELKPNLLGEWLTAMGVKLDAFPSLRRLEPTDVVNDLGRYIPSAHSVFNFGQQRLDISIPQAALNTEAREYVDPASWDEGMPAALFNYSYSGSNTRSSRDVKNTSSGYLNLRSGVNLGAWRLRNYSTYTDADRGGKTWNSINTYVQRDVQNLKGQLTVGQGFTPSNVFESVQFKGAQLASDDNMLPDSLRGFAPVVRGIAQTNAQVTVRQNGYVIYQTYVAPGAFAISDLYPTSASGDLEVIIKEADGTERRSTQAFSAVPTMVREGQLKYAVTAGRFDSQIEGAVEPTFVQSSLIYGLPYATTIYGGQLTASNYAAFALGVGHGFGEFGSLSFDVTQAKARLDDGSSNKGRSYRVQYAKDIRTTGTTFTLAGYRYATDGYYEFQEANDVHEASVGSIVQNYIKRSKTQLTVNQSMGRYGSVYVSGYQQDYWARSGFQRDVSAGYNVSYRGANYNFSYTYSESPGFAKGDQQIAFSVQVPFDTFWGNSWANVSLNADKRGVTSQQVGISGVALADNNLNYSAQQSHGAGVGNSGTLSADYRGSSAQVGGGYSYSKDSQQINYNVQGGVVVHPYGVTLSQPLSDTIALVRAPGASDVKVENNTGIYTDAKGYAVVPYVSTYRKTRIALDTQTLQEDVDIKTTSQTVIPTQGAVVLANFVTRVGVRVMFRISHKGKAVPFGASVDLVQGDGQDPDNTSIVGGNGEVYLSGVPQEGKLAVQWGASSMERCQVSFVLPSQPREGQANTGSPVINQEALCL